MSEHLYILFTYVTFCIKCLSPFLICDQKVWISTYSNVLYFCLSVSHSSHTTPRTCCSFKFQYTSTPITFHKSVYTMFGPRKETKNRETLKKTLHARIQDKQERQKRRAEKWSAWSVFLQHWVIRSIDNTSQQNEPRSCKNQCLSAIHISEISIYSHHISGVLTNHQPTLGENVWQR